MKEKSFELEDYKPAFPYGPINRLKSKSPKMSSTGVWYKFCLKFPQYKPFLKKPSALTKIISTFHHNMISACIENRSGVEFPERLGILFIGSYVTGDKQTDYATSAKLLKRVSHRNLHTDGFAACIKYDVNSNCNYIHSDLWEFYAEEPFRHKVSEAFKKYWTRYVRLENLWARFRLKNNYFMREYAIKKETELLIDYNEFYVI